jgi:hypothetical protein
MKDGSLTVKQQAKHRAKAFRLLLRIGFQLEGADENAFYWLKVNRDKRVCVAFDVLDQCSGGRTGWVWQTAKLDETPLFGYSGTTSIGPTWATSDRIISMTLNKIWEVGMSYGLEIEHRKVS